MLHPFAVDHRWQTADLRARPAGAAVAAFRRVRASPRELGMRSQPCRTSERVRTRGIDRTSGRLLDSDEVACPVADGAVADPVGLFDWFLDDLGAARLQALEGRVEV